MLISMSDLINDVYLPDFDKRKIRDSDAYKLLKDNNKDTSVLEGYENTEKIEPIEFPVFNTESDRTKFVEENAASVASGAKDYLETFGNFLTILPKMSNTVILTNASSDKSYLKLVIGLNGLG